MVLYTDNFKLNPVNNFKAYLLNVGTLSCISQVTWKCLFPQTKSGIWAWKERSVHVVESTKKPLKFRFMKTELMLAIWVRIKENTPRLCHSVCLIQRLVFLDIVCLEHHGK